MSGRGLAGLEERPGETVPAPDRRSLFRGLTAVALTAAAPAAATTHPDAELIRVTAAFVAMSREICDYCRLGMDLPADDPEEQRLFRLQVALVPRLHDLMDQVVALPALTLDGLWAKAEALRHRLSADADHEDEPMDPDQALAFSLAKDVLAMRHLV